MKENCFVRFTIEGEDGMQYGIHNPEANIIMCACCGGIYTPGEDVIILESAGIGLEAYDAIMEVFNEQHFCNSCIHITQEITDDVACCNCCERNSMYSPMVEVE